VVGGGGRAARGLARPRVRGGRRRRAAGGARPGSLGGQGRRGVRRPGEPTARRNPAKLQQAGHHYLDVRYGRLTVSMD
jgi:hypothetical protein